MTCDCHERGRQVTALEVFLEWKGLDAREEPRNGGDTAKLVKS